VRWITYPQSMLTSTVILGDFAAIVALAVAMW
jgi:hypothetical protein